MSDITRTGLDTDQPNIQPGTVDATLTALSVMYSRRGAERDFFPCAFCGESYPDRAARQEHEQTCPHADDHPPSRYPASSRSFDIRTRQLPNKTWEAIDYESFDPDPESRWCIRGQGNTPVEAALWLLEYLGDELNQKGKPL
jgi:hypothetical protein